MDKVPSAQNAITLAQDVFWLFFIALLGGAIKNSQNTPITL